MTSLATHPTDDPDQLALIADEARLAYSPRSEAAFPQVRGVVQDGDSA